MEPNRPFLVTDRTVERLMRERITEQKARDLIARYGINWQALVREARLIRRGFPPATLPQREERYGQSPRSI